MFLQQLLNGITLSSIYVLIAIGLTMIYGVLQLLHFAHGGVLMLGAYAAMSLILTFNMPFIPAFLLALVVGGLLGILVEYFAYRPLRNANVMTVLISGLGVGIFFENLARLIFSSYTRPFPQEQAGLTQHIYNLAGSVFLTNYQIYVYVVTFVLVLALHLFLHHTRMGLAIQATAQNPDAASLMGINRNMVVMLTFFIGSAMATAAGVLVALVYNSLYPSMGSLPGLKAFSVVILGGLGSIPGTILGGFVVGLSEVFGSVYLPHVVNKHAIAFVILIIVMIFRPQGLFGTRVEKV